MARALRLATGQRISALSYNYPTVQMAITVSQNQLQRQPTVELSDGFNAFGDLNVLSACGSSSSTMLLMLRS